MPMPDPQPAPPADPILKWAAFGLGVGAFLVWAYATLAGLGLKERRESLD